MRFSSPPPLFPRVILFFDNVTSTVTTAVSDNTFTKDLEDNAIAAGVKVLAYASSSSVELTLLSNNDDGGSKTSSLKKPSLSGGAIAGIAIAAVAAIGIAVYAYLRKKNNNVGKSNSDSNPSVKNNNVGKSNSDSNPSVVSKTATGKFAYYNRGSANLTTTSANSLNNFDETTNINPMMKSGGAASRRVITDDL